MAVDTAPRNARRMWSLFESIHAVTYFAPHVPAAFEQLGLHRFWRSYFAGRAAPLGSVGAAPFTALFFNLFAPTMVARALPDVWTRITPEQALQTRLGGTTVIGPDVLSDVDVPRSLEVDREGNVRKPVVATASTPASAATSSRPHSASTAPRCGRS